MHDPEIDSITLTGSPNFTAPTGPQFQGSLTLNLSQLWPVIVIGGGASLQLQNIVLTGLKSAADPDLALPPNATRPLGWLEWPSFDAEPGAKISIYNSLIVYPDAECTPARVYQRVGEVQQKLGTGALGLMPPPYVTMIYNHGHRSYDLPLLPVMGGGPSHGSLAISSNETATQCFLHPNASSQAAGGGGTGPSTVGNETAWWVWLLVALGALVALVAAAGLTGLGHQEETAISPTSSGKSDLTTLEEPSSPKPDVEQPLPEGLLQLRSTMRVRFGVFDQVELGPLIGRGGYGRVYRAKWRGAPVAVKVVEHSMHSSTPWESVLGTTISHPNIVATYRVHTVEVGGRSAGSLGIAPDSSTSPVGPSPNTSEQCSGSGQPPAASSDSAGARADGGPAVDGSTIESGSGADTAGSAEDSARDAASPASSGMRAAIGCMEDASQEPSSGLREGGAVAIQIHAARAGQFYETWMLLEYCDKGSLAESIKARRFLSRRTGQPHLRAVLMCLADVARGMAYLHAQQIVHGDLGAANVLMKSREDGGKGFTCKIADLGLSRLLDKHNTLLTQTVGTLGYMPPEVMTHGRVTKATDVYSFGMLMYELAACRLAYRGYNAAQVFYMVIHQGERPSIPVGLDLPRGYVDLMQRCWAATSEARPSAVEVLTELEVLLSRMAP
ncbi:hypothetical protein N2152v2_006783 [Parachlorella kessleri]